MPPIHILSPLSMPPLLHILQNVSHPGALEPLRRFYDGPASSFRVFIDDACGAPGPDWRRTWASPRQWGLTGEKNWATKYAAAGFLPRMVEQSPFVTPDWRAASASLVVLFARSYAGGPALMQQQCLQRLRQRSAAWRATNGSRHFFIFTDSRGPRCLDGCPKSTPNSLVESPARPLAPYRPVLPRRQVQGRRLPQPPRHRTTRRAAPLCLAEM